MTYKESNVRAQLSLHRKVMSNCWSEHGLEPTPIAAASSNRSDTAAITTALIRVREQTPR